jgi:GSH-dependent disulfide-bond oxidoreductase
MLYHTRRTTFGDHMIDLYSWATPNGHKIHIMLEECGLPYQVHPINISAGDQFQADFLSISPNNKIPAIVDAEGPDIWPAKLAASSAKQTAKNSSPCSG